MRLVLAALAILVAACSSPADAPGVDPPPAASSPTATHERQVEAVVRAVQRYLDTWAQDGPVAASRLLVPRMRVTSDHGMPTLATGRVTSADLRWWRDPAHFTVLVTMDLRFDGSPYAWNRGSNTRFAKLHGPRGLLSLTSGP